MRFALALALVAATSARAQDISVSIQSPGPNSAWHDDIGFSLNVTSRFVIERLSVRLNDVETVVATNAFAGTFSGSISIANVPDGTYSFDAVARDVNQSVGATSVLVKIDRSPPPDLDAHLTDVSINYSGENRRQLEIKARCLSPPGSKCELNASGSWSEWNSRFYETKSDFIKKVSDGSITLKLCFEADDGARIGVGLSAFNQTGASDALGAGVPLELSAGLTATQVVPGEILDSDGERILYVRRQGEAVIRTVSTGEDLVLGPMRGYWRTSPPARRATYTGFLFSSGALFLDNLVLMEHRPGALNNLGEVQTTPQVSGDFAIWTTPAGETILRDLKTGTNQTVAMDMIVSPSGAISAPVSSPGYTRKSDGINTAWVERGQVLVLQTSMGRIEFDNTVPTSDITYALANGWLAFALPNGASPGQVWLRSPDGVTLVATQWGTPSRVEAVSPTGEFVSLREGRRRLDSRDIEEVEFGTDRGTVFWNGRAWFKWAESTLFRVTPEGNPVPIKSCPPPEGQCSTTGAGLFPPLLALWMFGRRRRQ